MPLANQLFPLDPQLLAISKTSSICINSRWHIIFFLFFLNIIPTKGSNPTKTQEILLKGAQGELKVIGIFPDSR